MRSDDQVDAAGIAAEHGETRGKSFAGMVIEAEQAGYAWADPPAGILLAGGVHAGIEQRRAPWMLDQIGRDRQLGLPHPVLHQSVEVAGQPAAGHRVELDTHDLLPIHPKQDEPYSDTVTAACACWACLTTRNPITRRLARLKSAPAAKAGA